jgi:hypothetical protein
MRFARCRMVSIALVLPFLFSVLPASAQEPSMPTISVVGEGIATATSDMAVVTVGVVSQAPLAADALAQNSKLMTEVIATAKKAGIEARDIATSRISCSRNIPVPARDARSTEGGRLSGEQRRFDSRAFVRQARRAARQSRDVGRQSDPRGRSYRGRSRAPARRSASRGDEGCNPQGGNACRSSRGSDRAAYSPRRKMCSMVRGPWRCGWRWIRLHGPRCRSRRVSRKFAGACPRYSRSRRNKTRP